MQWDAERLRDPHGVADKRVRVRRMFAAIAGSYDLNNRLHSLGMDQRWRRRAVTLAGAGPGERIVDVACGTGDLALAFARARLARVPGDQLLSRDLAVTEAQPAGIPGVQLPARDPAIAEAQPAAVSSPRPTVLGIDFTYEMLPLAARKAAFINSAVLRKMQARGPHHKMQSPPRDPAATTGIARVRFINGDAMALPLPDACCDVVSIAFGIRNVQDPASALREFHRVLRPGGRLIVLEFSLPRNRLLRAAYQLYFQHVLPRTATLISRDKTGAYRYLPRSVDRFISPEQMLELITAAGFHLAQAHPLTFGVCVCHRAVR